MIHSGVLCTGHEEESEVTKNRPEHTSVLRVNSDCRGFEITITRDSIIACAVDTDDVGWCCVGFTSLAALALPHVCYIPSCCRSDP
jgi:hypothetical protein